MQKNLCNHFIKQRRILFGYFQVLEMTSFPGSQQTYEYHAVDNFEVRLG